jgi:hypothetical protein
MLTGAVSPTPKWTPKYAYNLFLGGDELRQRLAMGTTSEQLPKVIEEWLLPNDVRY